MKIQTNYWAKPIPPRNFDWEATFENFDLGCPVGYGATEREAIRDLLSQVEDDQ